MCFLLNDLVNSLWLYTNLQKIYQKGKLFLENNYLFFSNEKNLVNKPDCSERDVFIVTRACIFGGAVAGIRPGTYYPRSGFDPRSASYSL